MFLVPGGAVPRVPSAQLSWRFSREPDLSGAKPLGRELCSLKPGDKEIQIQFNSRFVSGNRDREQPLPRAQSRLCK